jgi:hypothetical protein
VEAQRQAKLIAQLEKEREKWGVEANEAGNRYVQVGSGSREEGVGGVEAAGCVC